MFILSSTFTSECITKLTWKATWFGVCTLPSPGNEFVGLEPLSACALHTHTPPNNAYSKLLVNANPVYIEMHTHTHTVQVYVFLFPLTTFQLRRIVFSCVPVISRCESKGANLAYTDWGVHVIRQTAL